MKSAWHSSVDGKNYTVELTDTRIRFSVDQGTPESYGSNDVPFRRFLRSEKWKAHASAVFGQTVLASLMAAAEARCDPTRR